MSEFDSKLFDTFFKKAYEVKAQLRHGRQRLIQKGQKNKAAREVAEIFAPGCSALFKDAAANRPVK